MLVPSSQALRVAFHSRTGKLLVNMLGTGGTRLVNLFVTMLFVPLAMGALGPSGYAAVAVSISLAAFSAYADLGLGASLVNAVAGIRDEESLLQARKSVSSVFYLLLCVAVVGTLLVIIWSVWGGGSVSAATACVLVLLGVPAGLYQRILFARQRSVEAGVWQTAGRLLGLAGIWISGWFVALSPTHFVIGLFGVPLVLSVVASFRTFGGADGVKLRPSMGLFSARVLARVLPLGLAFLVLQMITFIEIGMDNVAVNWLLGAEVVAAYDVYVRLFMYVPALVSIAIFPLWPALANAQAVGDLVWITRIKRVAYFSVVFVSLITSGTLLFVSRDLVMLWAKQPFVLPITMLLALAGYSVLTSVASLQSIILNGAGFVMRQAKITVVYLLVLTGLKLYLLSNVGLAAMLWATVLLALGRFVAIEISARRWARCTLGSQM